MNPTTSFFIKLAILISLSLQVCASDSFQADALVSIEEGLDALRTSRKHLRRRQTVETTPNPTKEEASATSTTKLENIPTTDTKESGLKDRTSSKEEELAGKMFETIIQMGSGLELVTSLASNTSEVLEHTKKVQGLVPQLNTLTNDLMSTVANKSDSLNKSFNSAGEAGETLTKSLKAIEQKPEDANTIKDNFKNLEKSFHSLLSASDNVAIAAIPQLAQFAKNEDQKVAGEQPTSTEKAEVNSVEQNAESKAAEKNVVESKVTEVKPGGELKAADPKVKEQKAAEPKGAEPKTSEQNNAEKKAAEPKGTEPKTSEPNGAEPKTGEPKSIEPIVPDVAVPPQ